MEQPKEVSSELLHIRVGVTAAQQFSVTGWRHDISVFINQLAADESLLYLTFEFTANVGAVLVLVEELVCAECPGLIDVHDHQVGVQTRVCVLDGWS